MEFCFRFIVAFLTLQQKFIGVAYANLRLSRGVLLILNYLYLNSTQSVSSSGQVGSEILVSPEPV